MALDSGSAPCEAAVRRPISMRRRARHHVATTRPTTPREGISPAVNAHQGTRLFKEAVRLPRLLDSAHEDPRTYRCPI
jgi:hypothetical protein